MNLNSLEKITLRSDKRLGRGTGSGKGKTSARGTKGQKARGKIPAAFIGGSLPLYKKLPFVRGWGNMKAGKTPIVIALLELNNFKANSTVSVQALVEAGYISQIQMKKRGIKILDKGELTVKGLNVEIPVSREVRAKIEASGGTVV